MCSFFKSSLFNSVQLEQGIVTSLLVESGTIKGVQYKTKAGQVLKAYAPLTIVCDGCFSNLRCSLCDPKLISRKHMMQITGLHAFTSHHIFFPFKSFWCLILKSCSHISGGYSFVFCWFGIRELSTPISKSWARYSSGSLSGLVLSNSVTEIRCLVDIPGQKLPSLARGEMAEYLKTIIAPQVPSELRDSFISAVDKGNIKTMPNRSMPVAPYPTKGALLMGDAFNMRHPLTGGGMTVALSDIVVLQNLLRPLHDLKDANSLCKYLESFYTLRKPVASTINTLAGALHKVFCASSDQARKEMRQACFDYLSLGGACSRGPVALLSGLNPCPLSLVIHFFAVAMYGVGRLLVPFPSLSRLWMGVRLISGASSIILPIIKAEGVRQMFFPATVPAYYRAAPA